MARKRLLTWHSPSARWKKQINGVVHYFGYGRDANDLAAYRDAEKRYNELRERHERIKPIAVPVTEVTVLQAGERFIQDLHSRYERREVGAQHFDKSRRNVEEFVGRLGATRLLTSVTELDLEDFRNHILSLPKSAATGKPISRSTAKPKLATVQKLMRWCWEMHLVEREYRNLRTYAHVDVGHPVVKTFTDDELKQIWELADPRLRCCIMLGLNCGYGQQDISDLKISEVNLAEGIIDRLRSKTGVPQRHKLWDTTKALLTALYPRDRPVTERFFRNQNGGSLTNEALVDDKYRRSDAIKSAFWRLTRELGINGGRSFYSLRKTAASEIERINSLVTGMFLAHSPREMKKHYAVPAWQALDHAVMEMETRFAFLKA